MSRDPRSTAAIHSTAALLSALPDIVLVLDGMARVNFASAGSDQLLGPRPRDWVGLSALDHIHPDDVGHVVERLNLARNGHPTPTSALQIRVSAGDDHWGIVAAHGFIQINVDRVAGTLVMLRDVTGQLTRESAQHAALGRVFNQTSSVDDLQQSDKVFIATELLPRLSSECDPSAPITAVIVMTVSQPDNPDGPERPETFDNPVGDLAHRVRKMLRPGDVLSRLGTSQIVIVCSGLTDAADGLEIARRLHNWCGPSPLRDTRHRAALELTTGVAIASEGDEANDVLEHAASAGGVVESGTFLSTAA